jgi:MFS family permease
MGAIIGPLIGLAVLTATQVDVRTALWLAVVPALVSVGLVLLVREDRPRERAAPSREPAGHSSLPEEPRGPGGAGGRPGRVGPPLDQRRDGRDDDGGLASPGPDADADEESPRDAHTHRKLPGRARALAAVLGMFALVNFPDALILLRLSDIGLSPASLLGAYALLNLTSTVVSYPAGALADRWARSRVYALGMGCFAAGYLGLGLVDSPGPAVVILLLYGGFAGITEGVSRAWISALAPAAQRGRAQGLLQGLSGVGILVAGLWAGLMWDAGPGDGVVPLLVGGTVAALAAIGLAGPGRRLEPAAAQQAGS